MICIISSSGGHLTEVLEATRLLSERPKFYITKNLPHIKELLKKEEMYHIIDPHKNSIRYILNFIKSFFLYIKKRPKIIITSGAGIAIPFCVIGKIFGSKLIFIESGSRISYPSRTGTFLYKWADLFIIQSEKLRDVYPDAQYKGMLI